MVHRAEAQAVRALHALEDRLEVRLTRALRSFHVPFVVAVSTSGDATVIFDADGRRAQPVRMK
jgi:hypothetical protein